LWLQWKAGEFESKCRHWVNQSTLPKEELLETPLAVPPLAEQKRIVAKVEELLSRVTATRDRLAKVLIFLQRFRQSVLAAACFGRLTEEWREKHPDTEPADRLRERIREKRLETAVTPRTRAAVLKAYEECAPLELSPDQELPDTWCLCQINDVGDVCNGSTPSRKHPEYWDGDIPWVSSGEVQNCLIVKTRERITRQGYDNSSVHLLPVGTVLLAMIGEGKTRGQSAVLEIEATINQNMAAIVLCHGLMSPRYLWYWFQHHYETTRQAGGGSGPQALNCQRVRELPLVLPSLEEQREIVRRVEALFARAEEFEKRVKSAALRAGHLMQSILAKAFRGDLVPTEADLARREHRTYEPASVLLARIKAEREREEPRPRRRGRGGRA
jgi:type I restriction enzyme S subunit